MSSVPRLSRARESERPVLPERAAHCATRWNLGRSKHAAVLVENFERPHDFGDGPRRREGSIPRRAYIRHLGHHASQTGRRDTDLPRLTHAHARSQTATGDGLAPPSAHPANPATATPQKLLAPSPRLLSPSPSRNFCNSGRVQCVAALPAPRKPVTAARNSSVFSIGGTCPHLSKLTNFAPRIPAA